MLVGSSFCLLANVKHLPAARSGWWFRGCELLLERAVWREVIVSSISQFSPSDHDPTFDKVSVDSKVTSFQHAVFPNLKEGFLATR